MEPEKKSNGAFIGLIVIIIILIIGGIYIWKEGKTSIDNTEIITTEDSTELTTLEADLEATDTNTGVDASLID